MLKIERGGIVLFDEDLNCKDYALIVLVVHEWSIIMDWEWWGKTNLLRVKHVLMPPPSPEIAQDLVW